MKRVIIDRQTEFEYKGQPVKFPNVLVSLLSIMKAREKNKWDNMILVTGAVGSAKSTMAQGIAGLWELLFGRELSMDNFTWKADGIVNFIDREDNETQVIIQDEAIMGSTGRDVITKQGNMLKVSLVVGRRKRHLYLLLIDELQEYNKKIISRASALIDCRTLMSGGRERRGYFKLYSQKQLREIYWLLKLQKIRYIKEYSATQIPFYHFANFEGVFIDEKEYEDRKIFETKQQAEETDKVSWKQDKVLAFYYWAKGSKHKEIAERTGCPISSIKSWSCGDFKKCLSMEVL